MFLSSRVVSQAPEVLVTLLVFSLASGVFGGVLFYVDSAAPDVMREMSLKTKIDMELQFRESFYTQSQLLMDEVNDLVRTQDGVLASESVAWILAYDWDIFNPRFRSSMCLGVNEDFFTVFPDAVHISAGSPPLSIGGCYVEEKRFLAEGLNTGDNYTFGVPIYYPFTHRVNYTFEILGSFESEIWGSGSSDDVSPFPLPSVITTEQGVKNKSAEVGYVGANSIEERIWVKFDIESFVGQEPNKVLSSLMAVERRIEQETLPYVAVSEFRLLSSMSDYSAWLSSIRVITLAFSVPSIVMGVLLIQYNSSLLASQWRGEVGTLKTRGASGRQAFNWIMSFSALIGVIGSLGAIATGGLAALVSGASEDLMVFNMALLNDFELTLWPGSVAALFLFSFAIGLAVAVPTAVRAFLLLPVDARSVVERESKKEDQAGNPVAQAGGAALSGVLVIPLLGILGSRILDPTGLMLYTVIVVGVLATFIVGFTSLLCRPAASLKARILLRARRSNPGVGILLMARTALASKRSEALGVMFIALVFTSSVFSSVAATTATNHVKELFLFRYGADVVVDIKPSSSDVGLSFVDEIMHVPGVAQASGMLEVYVTVGFWKEWAGIKALSSVSMTLYGIQPRQWLESAFVLPYFTLYHPPADSVGRLSEDNSSVVASFMPVLRDDVDALGNPAPVYYDQITLEVYGPTGPIRSNRTIIDVMADGPEGANRAQTYYPGESDANDFVVIDLRYLHSCLNSTKLSRIYVRLQPGADYSTVMQGIYSISPDSIGRIQSPYRDVQEVLRSRTGQSVNGTYALNLMFSFLYLAAGTCLVVTTKARNMRRHFSLLRALGTNQKAIEISMLVDTLTGMVMGLAIGCIFGLVVAVLMLNVPLSYLGAVTSVSWKGLPMTIVFPIQLLAGIVTVAFLFSLLSAYLVTQRNLTCNIADDLKLRE